MARFDNLIDDNVNNNPDGGKDDVRREPQVKSGASGVSPDDIYTEEEQNDVNAITVTIPDTQTPIVVFFGPQSSGKTLVLLRIIRFLEGHDYSVVPEAVFRPKSDRHYARMCTILKNQAYDSYAPLPTDVISFMLVKVLDRGGNPVCQILEAPGEHYFDGTSNLDFPTYINQVRTTSNRKVWVFFVEQDWGENQGVRDFYAQKIREMQRLISPRDKVVFLFNKADLFRTKGQYNNAGRPIEKAFFRNIKIQYPGIFDKFENKGMLKFLYGDYNFKAVCFSSGVFNRTASGRQVWTIEDDSYCEELWKLIR